MSKDEIIPSRTDVLSMAREADREWDCDRDMVEWLERFAALVAAAARAEEREACAKVVEASPSYDWHRFACEAAAAIRARKENT